MSGPAPDGGGIAEARIRDCLDAVLWATQGADQHTSHVTMALPVMDDIARVLEAILSIADHDEDVTLSICADKAAADRDAALAEVGRKQAATLGLVAGYAQIIAKLEREKVAAEAALAEARDQSAKLVAQLRVDLANAAGGMAQSTCEGCGAALMVDEHAATTTDVVGCWPYVTGGEAKGPCWRYRTADGADRAWPACALVDHAPTCAENASAASGVAVGTPSASPAVQEPDHG